MKKLLTTLSSLLIILLFPLSLFAAQGVGFNGVGSGGGADVTAPTLSSSTVPSAGTTISLLFSEVVSVGAGGNAGWSASFSTQGATTMTYSSGSGSNTLVYSLNKTVTSGETGTVAYTQPGNGIEDSVGNDLATIASAAITNNSTQSVSECTGTLLCQNFEGTGYDNSETWTETINSGTINEDYTSTVLRGSQSLYITDSDDVGSYVKSSFSSAPSQVWIHVIFRKVTAASDSSDVNVFEIQDASNNTLAGVYSSNSTTFVLFAHGGEGGTFTNNAGTTYHWWFRYNQGSGANGTIEFWNGSTATRPGSNTRLLTDGTATGAPAKIVFGAEFGGVYIIDQVIVDDAEFTTVSE